MSGYKARRSSSARESDTRITKVINTELKNFCFYLGENTLRFYYQALRFNGAVGNDIYAEQDTKYVNKYFGYN
jgi:hypothetical protein